MFCNVNPFTIFFLFNQLFAQMDTCLKKTLKIYMLFEAYHQYQYSTYFHLPQMNAPILCKNVENIESLHVLVYNMSLYQCTEWLVRREFEYDGVYSQASVQPSVHFEWLCIYDCFYINIQPVVAETVRPL